MARPTEADRLANLLADISFVPHPEMRKVKAKFWVNIAENPTVDPAHLSLEQAVSATDDARLRRWWGMEGFRSWFTNRDEFRHRLEYIADLALDGLEKILISDQSQDSARVRAAQIVLEAAGKMPSRTSGKETYLDEKIHRMDRRELEEYIRRAAALLPTIQPAVPLPARGANPTPEDVPDPSLPGRSVPEV